MANNTEAIYFEIDLPYCANTFGVSPCTASGTPCFNTRNNSYDCQDIPNYSATTKTVRFALNNGHTFWPRDDVPTFPILSSASSDSATLDPGESMGARAKCSVTLENCKSLLAELDKNVIARSQDDYDKGTFLGKFKARNPYIFGSPCRLYRGVAGDPESQFEVENYIVDNWSGPSAKGGMAISCVDFLKLMNGDKSNFPAPSEGTLVADINETDTSFDVPAGLGSGYPASGLIAVGNEAMEFTRSGDTFTVVRDGPNSLGKVEAHKAGETAQIVGEYTAQSTADIINDLVVNYTPLDSSYVPLAEWQDEVGSFQSALYTAKIVKPTPVNVLINELCQQAGLIIWADVSQRKIRLKVVRPVANTAIIDEDNISGFTQKEIQGDRVSQVWVYYNQKDPFKKLDDFTNYYSRLRAPTAENLYQTESIKKIYSRWIPLGGQPNAIDIATRQIERYKNPPREYDFDVYRTLKVSVGNGRIISHRSIEDAFGNTGSTNCYITRATNTGMRRRITAKEFVFSDYSLEGGGSDIVIPIENSDGEANIDLRSLFGTVRGSLIGITSVTFRVISGTTIGSFLNSEYALTVGDFGGIVPLLIIENGAYIVGKGGDGYYTDSPSGAGNGGPSINADFPISIQNNGVIGGGGGAGGSGYYRVNNTQSPFGAVDITSFASMPGAGFKNGFSATPLNGINIYSTLTDGYLSSDFSALLSELGDLQYNFSGDGGSLGESGSAGNISSGFPAGSAIENNSNITWVSTGTILGAVNG